MYMIGLYFTYLDDPKYFKKTFNNENRMTPSQQELKDLSRMKKNIKEQYSAPTES